jgi:hypothetical protein
LLLNQAPDPQLVPEDLKANLRLLSLNSDPFKSSPRQGPYDVAAGPLFSNGMPLSFSPKIRVFSQVEQYPIRRVQNIFIRQRRLKANSSHK